MTKAPRLGDVKSRLAAELGEEYSVGLYRCFLLDMLETLSSTGAPFIIYYTPDDALDELKTLLGEDHQYIPQEGNDLGERLYNGMKIVEELGFHCAVVLASDVPDITVEYLSCCVDALDGHDAVIGPSTDGGYNLLGLNLDHLDEGFFSGVTWGTETVFEETIQRLEGLDVHLLDPMGDIDDASDLEKLRMRVTSHTMRYLRALRES